MVLKKWLVIICIIHRDYFLVIAKEAKPTAATERRDIFHFQATDDTLSYVLLEWKMSDYVLGSHD